MGTLTDDEMARIKAELLDNVLDLGALPYATILAVYDLVRRNVSSSSVEPTTSTTAVTSAGPAVLTLASVTGLASGSRVVLDVDASREVVTVRAVSGSTISVVCTKTHSGTYPVEVESALTIVRGILADLEAIDQQERIAIPQAGVKRVDEVEFFGATEGGSAQSSLTMHRNTLRGRLATAIGLTRVLRENMGHVGAPAGIEAY